MKRPIYMDYSATTPVDPRVAEKMMGCLTLDGTFGNPASRSHSFGWEAEAAVENAREQVAALVNADSKEIVWTSGATESDNLAIKGVAHFYQKKGRHIVTCKTEHKAVLDTCRQLEREGFEVTYLDPEPNGLVDLNKLEAAIRADTSGQPDARQQRDRGDCRSPGHRRSDPRQRHAVSCGCRAKSGQSADRPGNHAGGFDVFLGPQNLRPQGHRCAVCAV